MSSNNLKILVLGISLLFWGASIYVNHIGVYAYFAIITVPCLLNCVFVFLLVCRPQTTFGETPAQFRANNRFRRKHAAMKRAEKRLEDAYSNDIRDCLRDGAFARAEGLLVHLESYRLVDCFRRDIDRARENAK